MSDNPPFPPFNPNPAPTPETPTETTTPKRRGRKPAEATEGGDAPRQRRKKGSGEKSSLKLDMHTALAVASMINDDDRFAFEQIVAILQEAGKPGRERLLAAVTKVFSNG